MGQLTHLSDEQQSVKTEITIKYFDRSNPLLKPKLNKSRFYEMEQLRLLKLEIDPLKSSHVQVNPLQSIESDQGNYKLVPVDPNDVAGGKLRKMNSETLNPMVDPKRNQLRQLSSFDSDANEINRGPKFGHS
jgi:hypothetical protein